MDRLLAQESSALFSDVTRCVDVFATLHNTAIQVVSGAYMNGLGEV